VSAWGRVGVFLGGLTRTGDTLPPGSDAALQFSHRSHGVHQDLSAINPISPLCDLRGLCAMLSPFMFSPGSRRVHQDHSAINPNFPPSVTSVTSVRCFPPCLSSRTEATERNVSGLDCGPTIPPVCEGAGIPSDPCYQLREFVSQICGSGSSNRGLFGVRNRGALSHTWRELENDRPGRSQSR
jgi:hypothetical protein